LKGRKVRSDDGKIELALMPKALFKTAHPTMRRVFKRAAEELER
jgi:hypothetical protein